MVIGRFTGKYESHLHIRTAELTGKSSFVSPDEKYFGKARDYYGVTEPVPANQWVVLAKRVVTFTETTRAYIRQHVEVPASIASDSDAAIFRGSFKLRIINNDTRDEVCLLVVYQCLMLFGGILVLWSE